MPIREIGLVHVVVNVSIEVHEKKTAAQEGE
jgi:hypothetical protein